MAAQAGQVDMVRCLVKELGADVNQPIKRDDGFTPLHAAAQFGHTDMAQCLINELGADFNNHADEEGWTAIDDARKKGHQAIVIIIEAAVLEAATQANLEITSVCEGEAAAAQTVAARTAPHSFTGPGAEVFMSTWHCMRSKNWRERMLLCSWRRERRRNHSKHCKIVWQ
jgi:ankyrin repeat protein